jgi:cytochrome P450
MPGTTPIIDAPLAPGRVPILGHLPKLAAQRLEFLQELRSGADIVRIQLGRRPMYVLNSPEAIYEVLVAQSRHFGKGLLFDRARPFVGNGIITSDGEFHRRQRRALQPAFHPERIEAYTGTLVDAARAQIDSWCPGTIIAMDREMRRLASAMLVTALFGPDSSGAANQTVESIGERVSGHLDVLVRGTLRATLLPSTLAALPSRGQRRFLTAAADLRRLADSDVQHARHNPGLQTGMLALMLAAPGGMSDQQARDELLSILIAGVETTSTTLAWAMYALGRYPEIAELVSREAHAVESGVADPTALPYTRRFLQEVLRLHQPNWILMRRALDTVRICSIELPAGAEIIYSAAALHRDPVYFPDPLRFDPDRWVTRTEKDLPRCAYIPFAIGNRKCIGDSFAWAEMIAAITTIMSRWRLHPSSGHTVRAVADAQIHPDALPMFVTSGDNR